MIRAHVWWSGDHWQAVIIDAEDCLIASQPFPTHAAAVAWADTETRRPLEAP